MRPVLKKNSIDVQEVDSVSSAGLCTQRELESAICSAIVRLQQDFMGRGADQIRAFLVENLLVVQMTGALTIPEKALAMSQSGTRGRDLLKLLRSQLLEQARPLLDEAVKGITGTAVVDVHHDINTATGAEIMLFTLSEQPLCRDCVRN